MLIKDVSTCREIIAGDNSILRELISPQTDGVKISYSMARAIVKPGRTTRNHKLKSSETYFVLKGEGVMYVDSEQAVVKAGQLVYIPSLSEQKIRNTGNDDLVFLCIVDPAWKPEDEEILEK